MYVYICIYRLTVSIKYMFMCVPHKVDIYVISYCYYDTYIIFSLSLSIYTYAILNIYNNIYIYTHIHSGPGSSWQ